MMLTNLTSVPYTIQYPGRNPLMLEPFSTLRINLGKKPESLDITVLNMWCGATEHPVVTLK